VVVLIGAASRLKAASWQASPVAMRGAFPDPVVVEHAQHPVALRLCGAAAVYGPNLRALTWRSVAERWQGNSPRPKVVRLGHPTRPPCPSSPDPTTGPARRWGQPAAGPQGCGWGSGGGGGLRPGRRRAHPGDPWRWPGWPPPSSAPTPVVAGLDARHRLHAAIREIDALRARLTGGRGVDGHASG